MAAELSTTDWAVLAALAEGEAHGFQIAGLFGPQGGLGEIWKLQRTQVYRALEHLQRQNLIEATRQETSEAGPPRTRYALTFVGQQQVAQWLNTPVTQLRYGRSDLRLKVAFLLRSGQSTRALLEAQGQVYHGLLAQLEQRSSHDPVEQMSLLWRLETARAGLRFVLAMLDRMS